MIFLGDFFEFILESIWFMLPSFISIIVPVYVRKINFLNIPVNEKIFGKNKTYRGFFFGVLASIIIVYFQKYLYDNYFLIKAISIIFYDKINLFLFGFSFGFLSLLGDLIKSYFKRKQKIKEGYDWIPFDNIDFSITSLSFIIPLFYKSFIKKYILYYLFIFIFSSFFHYIVVKIAYKLKIR